MLLARLVSRSYLRFALRGAAVIAIVPAVAVLPAQPMADVFVRPGDRIRVTIGENASIRARRVGVLQRVHRDSVTVHWPGGARETLPLQRLSGLEVSDGTGNLLKQGMTYGFLAGVAGGAVYGIARADEGGEYVPPVAMVSVMSIAGGLLGTVTGGLIGAAQRRERWTPVRLEQPLRRVTVAPYLVPVRAGPSRTGVHVGVRF
jgi:hypothetical protein